MRALYILLLWFTSFCMLCSERSVAEISHHVVLPDTFTREIVFFIALFYITSPGLASRLKKIGKVKVRQPNCIPVLINPELQSIANGHLVELLVHNSFIMSSNVLLRLLCAQDVA